MAPGRIYRDYSGTAENDSYDLTMEEQQAHTAQNDDGPPDSPQTAILENGSHAKEANTKYIGAGIAQTTDDVTTSSTTDDESTSEPMLHQEQIDDSQYHDGAAAAPAIPFHMRALSPSGVSSFSKPGPAVSVVSHDNAPTPSIRSESSKKMPEFFSQTTFQTVLNNPTISHQFLKFACSRLCGENLEFLGKVSRYRGLLEEVSKSVYEIHKEFISASSANQVNLTETEHKKVNSEMKAALNTTIPSLESMFVDAQSHIEDLVYRDVYRKFVQYQMSISAAKALGRDRSKYAGLGDCFVLTDPSKVSTSCRSPSSKQLTIVRRTTPSSSPATVSSKSQATKGPRSFHATAASCNREKQTDRQ